MVNVFVIHAGNDYDYVKNEVEPFLTGSSNDGIDKKNVKTKIRLLIMESGKNNPKKANYNWKKDAGKKIKDAHAVIIIIGSEANQERRIENMKWEVDQAKKYNKLLFIINRDNYELPHYLYRIDQFNKHIDLIAPISTLESVKKRLDNYADGYYNIFSLPAESVPDDEKNNYEKNYLEQYKMFQKSSEDLVSRRQSVSSFYISVNSAIIAFIGVIIGFLKGNNITPILILLCVTGIILDSSWIKILDAYGTLNSAKMKVIRLMEKHLPISLYDSEWMIMSDKLNNKKYVSFTDSEKRIPKIFVCLYTVVILFLIVYSIYTNVDHIKEILPFLG